MDDPSPTSGFIRFHKHKSPFLRDRADRGMPRHQVDATGGRKTGLANVTNFKSLDPKNGCGVRHCRTKLGKKILKCWSLKIFYPFLSQKLQVICTICRFACSEVIWSVLPYLGIAIATMDSLDTWRLAAPRGASRLVARHIWVAPLAIIPLWDGRITWEFFSHGYGKLWELNHLDYLDSGLSSLVPMVYILYIWIIPLHPQKWRKDHRNPKSSGSCCPNPRESRLPWRWFDELGMGQNVVYDPQKWDAWPPKDGPKDPIIPLVQCWLSGGPVAGFHKIPRPKNLRLPETECQGQAQQAQQPALPTESHGRVAVVLVGY